MWAEGLKRWPPEVPLVLWFDISCLQSRHCATLLGSSSWQGAENWGRFQVSETRGQGWWGRIRGMVRGLWQKKAWVSITGKAGPHLSFSCPSIFLFLHIHSGKKFMPEPGSGLEALGKAKIMLALKPSQSRFKSWLCHLPAMLVWAGDSISQSSFQFPHLYSRGIIIDLSGFLWDLNTVRKMLCMVSGTW